MLLWFGNEGIFANSFMEEVFQNLKLLISILERRRNSELNSVHYTFYIKENGLIK